MNLVGSLDRGALEIHVQDSLAAAPHVPRGARVADLGSGAGFPGIPLSIARPDLEICLVESRERRVHFLRHVARALDLEITIRRCRLEEIPPETYDIVLMRAVAQPKRAVALGTPWVAPDGELWLWSRSPPPESAPGLAGAIELASDRGRILRLQGPAVPRGTVPR